MRKKVVFLPYDFDTAIGTNNEGSLVFPYGLEDSDTYDGADVYNGQDSALWKNVRAAFANELKTMYKNLRSTGALSYEKVEQMFEDHQEKCPEAINNEDSWYKYLAPLVEPDAGENPTDMYLPMLQGTKELQRKWWLYNQFRYMDSKYNAGDALTDTIILRGYQKSDITVTPYADIYASILYGSYLVQVRAKRNHSYTLACPLDNVNDTETAIYSASQLADVGDLSGYKVGLADFSKAVRLQSIKIGDSSSSYSNPNLKSLTLGNNTLLKSLDARNCPNLTGNINISGCTGIEDVYFSGTSIASLTLPNGGVLDTLVLPGTVTNLTVRNQTKVQTFTMPTYENITTLRLENVSDAFDPVTIMDSMQDNSRVRLVGFEWDYDTYEEISDFYDLLDAFRGLDENGNNTDKAQVSGTIHIESMTGAQMAELQARYPYIVIDATHTSSVRTYANWDGTTIKTVNCLDGAPQDSAPSTASRASTAQYTYTFIGWSTSQDSETADFNPSSSTPADTTVYAAYRKTLQTYTITWKNQDGTILETDTGVAYGSTPTYNGATPTYNGQTAVGWAPNVTTVTGNATYTARYRAEHTVRFYNGSTLLDTATVLDGDDATYTGSTPTNADNTTFLGWARSSTATEADANALNNITANTDVYAIFEDPFVYEDAEISDSWDTIISSIDNGTYKTKYKVGNYKALDLGTDGNINFRICAIDADTASNGTGKVALTFCPDSALNYGPVRVNSANTYLQTDFVNNVLPANIRDRLVYVDKYTRTSNGPNELLSKRVWLFSVRELGFTSYETLGVTYDKFFNVTGYIKTQNSTATKWFARTSSPVVTIKADGSLQSTANSECAIVPGFCLGTYMQAHKSADTLDDVIAASSDGTYATKYKVGDIFDLDLGTEGNVMAQILAFDADDKADGSGKAHVSLGTYYVTVSNTKMNETNTTEGGYRDSVGRAFVQNTIKPLFPANVLSSIVPVTKTQVSYNNGTSEMQTTTEDVFMLNAYGEMDTGGIYANVLERVTARIKTKFGAPSTSTFSWWLRSASSSSSFRSVTGNGTTTNSSATIKSNVIVGFCL